MPNQNRCGTEKNKVKVLVVDKDSLIRQQISNIVRSQDDLEICAEVESSGKALKSIELTNPNIVIIDLSLGGDLQGLKLAKKINTGFPLLDILIISGHNEYVFAEYALKAGARGYLMKNDIPKTLISAIRQILNENIYLSSRVMARVANRFVKRRVNKYGFVDYCLSDHQLKILELIAYGLNIAQIADELCLSIEKIENHYRIIMQKLQIRSDDQLYQYAVKWLEG